MFNFSSDNAPTIRRRYCASPECSMRVPNTKRSIAKQSKWKRRSRVRAKQCSTVHAVVVRKTSNANRVSCSVAYGERCVPEKSIPRCVHRPPQAIGMDDGRSHYQSSPWKCWTAAQFLQQSEPSGWSASVAKWTAIVAHRSSGCCWTGNPAVLSVIVCVFFLIGCFWRTKRFWPPFPFKC